MGDPVTTAAGVDAGLTALAGTGAIGAGAGAASAGAAALPSISGLGSALSNTALGTTSGIGTGLTLGSGGVTGLTAAPGAAASIAPSMAGGAELASMAAPGMGGASGLGGMAATGGLGGQHFMATVPSNFNATYTLGDASKLVGNGAKGVNSVSPAMKVLNDQQQQQMRAVPQARPVFQGAANPITPSSAAPQNMYQLQMMMARRGLLG